jgi:mutator protein MutT
MKAATVVGIAIVEHEGAYLVGTRGPNGPLAGYDEFPGGKCLPGESPRDCACRECREEAQIRVSAVELLECLTFTYPHGDVELHFWRCELVEPRDHVRVNSLFRWASAADLAAMKFPDANASVVKKLMADR